MKNNKFINIVIVNYKANADLMECIQALLRNNYRKIRIFIADCCNDPNDSIALKEWIRKKDDFSFFPCNDSNLEKCFKKAINQKKDNKKTKIPLLLLSEKNNIGFASANNIFFRYFLKELKDEFIFLVNPDTNIDKNAIKNLSEYASLDNLELIGLTTKNFHSQKLITYGGYQFNSWTGSVKPITNYNTKKIDYIHGGAVFLNLHTLKEIGPFSTDYFLYGDDLDWGIVAKKNNIKLTCLKTAVCFDKVGTAAGRGVIAHYFFTFNVLLIVKKFYILKIINVSLFQIIRIMYFLILKNNFSACKGTALALFDFVIYGRKTIKL